MHQRANASFFPAHDLTHLAVETTLGLANAFYGLTAAGWDVTDFGSPWPRGPLSRDAARSELIVGYLDRERADIGAGGRPWTAADFNAHAAAHYVEHARAEAPPVLEEATLDCVRAARDALCVRWRAVPIGETLALEFPLDPPRP